MHSNVISSSSIGKFGWRIMIKWQSCLCVCGRSIEIINSKVLFNKNNNLLKIINTLEKYCIFVLIISLINCWLYLMKFKVVQSKKCVQKQQSKMLYWICTKIEIPLMPDRKRSYGTCLISIGFQGDKNTLIYRKRESD